MTRTVEDSLDEVERHFLLSPVVVSCGGREREERRQEGFIRIRAELANGDLLEAFEFVVAETNEIQTLTYRIHWQEKDGGLKRRWENAPRHTEIPTFPHHVHRGPAEDVSSSEPMTIMNVIAFLENEIRRDEGLWRSET